VLWTSEVSRKDLPTRLKGEERKRRPGKARKEAAAGRLLAAGVAAPRLAQASPGAARRRGILPDVARIKPFKPTLAR